MTHKARMLIRLGLILELGVALFPPLSAHPVLDGLVLNIRQRHLFLFAHTPPAWSIDAGALIAYVVVIAVLTALAAMPQESRATRAETP